FNKLLASLDPDSHRAGERYEHLRRSLIKYFDWRGSEQPETDADETIDRLARKLYEGVELGDLYSYGLGVARMVALESLRSQERARKTIEQLPRPSKEIESGVQSESRIACFDMCLARLDADKRELIVRYYEGDKKAKISERRRLAEQLGMPVARLRIQAHRIRERLEACIKSCLSSESEI
ncbi:MAG TPA: hypothetical protein VLD57_12305, partial [Blastocatellia bacterium]|nr:hypothetical protein [Blastocatellia bacterium]